MLFAGASFERSVFEAPFGVARVPGITRTRRNHLGEPTRRVHAPCVTGRAFPVADRSLTSRSPHQAPPIDFVRPEAPVRCDLSATPHRRTCWARIPREPPGEGENQRRPGDACHRTCEPEAFAPDPRSRAPSMTDVVRGLHTRSLETLSPPLPRQRRWEVGTELARRIREVALRLPLDDGRRCCLPIAAIRNQYEHPLLVDFPATSADDLRHLRRAWRARCFTTPKPAGEDPRSCSGRHFLLLRALGPSSGRPCRSFHSRPRPSRGRVEMPLRVGRGPSWRPPRSLPPPIREDRRLSRSGTPSVGEHPSRVFLRASGFAATARPLFVPFLHRDASRQSETPGHTAAEFPPGRCFARSDEAHRFLQYDRRADTPRTPRLPLSGMPSGILVPAHLREDMREACGPAAPRDCSRVTIRTRSERARTARARRDR